MTLPPCSDPVEIVVPLHEEDISIERREVERDVRVHVHTVNHDHLIDEALAHERVEVERVPVGRPIDAVPPIREEGDTTVISVVEEVLVVERRLVLKEEIRLRRVRTTEQHREMVTLREQQAVIERSEPGGRRLDPLPELAPIAKPQALKEPDDDR
jgi:stress response protein YsnF